MYELKYYQVLTALLRYTHEDYLYKLSTYTIEITDMGFRYTIRYRMQIARFMADAWLTCLNYIIRADVFELKTQSPIIMFWPATKMSPLGLDPSRRPPTTRPRQCLAPLSI
jgi:hypothetical protein